MESQPKKCVKSNNGLFRNTLDTFEDPCISNQYAVNTISPEFTKSILTYEELKELKMALADYEARKAQIIERLRTRLL